MKVNWGALGITIGLILVAVSILAMGLMAGQEISEFTLELTTLEKQIPTIEASITSVRRSIIAQGYAFRKASSEERALTPRDLEEGYVVADKFIGE